MVARPENNLRGSTFRLAEMTWPEIARAREVAPIALIPLGATEQHGAAMALQTDTLRATAVADRVAARLAPRVVVTPTLPFGMSEHHMAFPGTLTLTAATFGQVLHDLAVSLFRHGWRRLFVLTGHGGNNSAIDTEINRLRGEFDDLYVAWSGLTPLASELVRTLEVSTVRGHSCEIETSQALYVDPSLVRLDQLRRGAADPTDLDPAGALSRSFPGIRFPQSYDQLSATGALGDARTASAELGARLIGLIVDRLAAFLDQFADLPARPPSTPVSSLPDPALTDTSREHTR